jgi:DNA-binding response OmpR family regulator
MPVSRTVLVIDDDPDIREILQMTLEDSGYRVLCAPDGEAGISCALKEAPDLVIVDMMMPLVSGFVVLERLKHHHQFAAPIIMLTGNDSDQQRVYAEVLGVDVYLNKPVQRTHLLEVVGRFCPLPIEVIVP